MVAASLNGISAGIHASRKRPLEHIHGVFVLGLRVSLSLLLGLGCLLSRLFLSLLFFHPLHASTTHSAHRGTDGGAGPGIASDRADGSTSRSTPGSAPHRSTLAHLIAGLLCGL